MLAQDVKFLRQEDMEIGMKKRPRKNNKSNANNAINIKDKQDEESDRTKVIIRRKRKLRNANYQTK